MSRVGKRVLVKGNPSHYVHAVTSLAICREAKQIQRVMWSSRWAGDAQRTGGVASNGAQARALYLHQG
jgi:hypothetical protein